MRKLENIDEFIHDIPYVKIIKKVKGQVLR
jgi:hypothetical protein